MLIPMIASIVFLFFFIGAAIEARPMPLSRPEDALTLSRHRLERGEISHRDFERIARVLTT